MTVENTGAALVWGRSQPSGDVMQTKRVKVLRPFLYDRKRQEPGSVIELPALFALECSAANKVEIVKGEAPAPAVEKSTERSAKGSDKAK